MNYYNFVHTLKILFIISIITFTSCSCEKLVFRATKPPEFSADQAYLYLQKICEIGPRPPASKGAKILRAMIEEILKGNADSLEKQYFDVFDSETSSIIPMVNIIARFNTKAKSRILLATHYDTRRWADYDPDPSNRDKPIIGANDGGSGVAVLLDLANIMCRVEPPCGVDMIFFDGEDFGRPGSDDYCQGSKFFTLKNRAY